MYYSASCRVIEICVKQSEVNSGEVERGFNMGCKTDLWTLYQCGLKSSSPLIIERHYVISFIYK